MGGDHEGPSEDILLARLQHIIFDEARTRVVEHKQKYFVTHTDDPHSVVVQIFGPEGQLLDEFVLGEGEWLPRDDGYVYSHGAYPGGEEMRSLFWPHNLER